MRTSSALAWSMHNTADLANPCSKTSLIPAASAKSLTGGWKENALRTEIASPQICYPSQSIEDFLSLGRVLRVSTLSAIIILQPWVWDSWVNSVPSFNILQNLGLSGRVSFYPEQKLCFRAKDIRQNVAIGNHEGPVIQGSRSDPDAPIAQTSRCTQCLQPRRLLLPSLLDLKAFSNALCSTHKLIAIENHHIHYEPLELCHLIIVPRTLFITLGRYNPTG